MSVDRVLRVAERALMRLPAPAKEFIARNGLRAIAVVEGVQEGLHHTRAEWADIEGTLNERGHMVGIRTAPPFTEPLDDE